ncbi:MAG TPA: AMP-binding protein, partial [Candidatus Lustribacter sp.]|nr:AMP-binding protein [Candidatus Lustribacter sp.]
MRAPLLVAVAVGAGRDALDLLGPLDAALRGVGPALLPHSIGEPAPVIAEGGLADGPGDLALAVGTSGSTGSPKRALLTAANLAASATATYAALGGPGQWVLALPATHIAGLQVLVRSLLAGTTPVTLGSGDGFTAAGFAVAVNALSAGRRYASLVPTQVDRLLRDAPGSAALAGLDAVLVGGAPAPPALLERAAAAGARVVRTYGMSETAGGCVYDGEPLPCTRIRVEQGRILVGGATVAHGYLGDLAATAAAFTTDGHGQRWFHT